MIKSKKMLKEWLALEEEAYREIGYKGKIHSFITQCEIGKITAYAKALRKDEYYTNTAGSSVFKKALSLWWRRKHNSLGCMLGISIPINTFEKGLLIYHSQGIIVHRDVRCGEYCKVHGNICIGNNGSDKVRQNVPILGNNIDIGVNSSIIGGITLVDGIKIAAGAVVCHSCYNKNSVLIGIPANEKSI